MLRPNGGGAAAAALSGGKKKKPNRENAYMLFSRVVREDMYQKFGGLQRFNEHFATHYQNEQDEGRIKIPSVKMAVIGNLWSEAPPGVRAFFERAAERKNAWDDAKSEIFLPETLTDCMAYNRLGLAGANAGSDEDIPIGRTRPQGGGKAHKIDHKNASATGGPAVNAKEGTRSLAVDARVDFGAQEKPGGKGTQVKQAAKKSTPMETVDTRVAGSRRESGGRSESKDDPDSPHATAAKVATAEGGKRGPSALESLPIAPGPAVSYDANSKTSTGVAKGVDQAAALSAKNEAKRRDHGERTDAAGEQKSAAGVPRDGKASERNVQGVAPKGRDKGKAPGEGKQAEEEENLANAKGETRLPSAGVSEGARSGERERDDGAVGKGKEKRASSESGGNRQKATVAANAKGETRLPSAGVSAGARSGERERDDGALGKGKEKRASSESGGNRQKATVAANAKGETRLPSAGVSEGARSGERERDDGAVGKGKEKRASSESGGNRQKATVAANAKGETRLPSAGVSEGARSGERERDDGAVGKGKEKRASSESGGNRLKATVAANAKGETRLPPAGVSEGARSGERERDDGAVGKGKEKRASSESGGNRQKVTVAANAKGETRLPPAGVSESARGGERERDDGAVGKGKEKRASSENGGNRQKATVAANTIGTENPDDVGSSSGTAKAGAVGGVVGEEKAAKDDRKSNSTGHGTSGGNATHRNDKSDKKESASSLGKSRGDLSATTGGKVKSGRREHGGEGGGGEKTKGSEEKRGETAAASEGSNAEERSRDKGKWKEKTKSAEKRKSIAEGKAIKGASKGGPSVGKASSVSSAKPRASPTEEAKVAKDPRRAPATKGPQRKEARSTNLDSRSSVATNSTKRKEARQPASSVPIASRGRRGGKEAAANAETSDNSSTPKDLTYFGLERGERVAIEVEWPVEVQKGGRKTEERLEWFSATVDLHKQLRADEEGRPKWTIHYARHGSLPASKSKVTFLGGDRLMDDYEDDPLRWRRKGSPLSTSEADSSPRRAGSAGGSSVGSSADHEVEWRDDFGLKPRRRS